MVIGHRPATRSRSRGAELEDSFDRRSGTAKRITLVAYRVASQANHASRRVICTFVCMVVRVNVHMVVHVIACLVARMIVHTIACVVVYKSAQTHTNMHISAPVSRRRLSSLCRASIHLFQFAGIYERLFTKPRQRQLLANSLCRGVLHRPRHLASRALFARVTERVESRLNESRRGPLGSSDDQGLAVRRFLHKSRQVAPPRRYPEGHGANRRGARARRARRRPQAMVNIDKFRTICQVQALTVFTPIAKLVRCVSEPPWPSARAARRSPRLLRRPGRRMVPFKVVFCLARHRAWQEVVLS